MSNRAKATREKADRRLAAEKVAEAARKRRAAERDRPRYSIANPPSGFIMSPRDLAELKNQGLNQTYREFGDGRWPMLPRPHGTGPYELLTVPCLEILRGERMPPTCGTAAVAATATKVMQKSRSERQRETDRPAGVP